MKLSTKITSAVFGIVVANILLVICVAFFVVPVKFGRGVLSNKYKYTLSGKVATAYGKAIDNAEITVLNGLSDMRTRTDKNGKFKIENISGGTYAVKVKTTGYKTSNQQVTVTKNKTLMIKLKPSQQ